MRGEVRKIGRTNLQTHPDKTAYITAPFWPQIYAAAINVCKGNKEFGGCKGFVLDSIESAASFVLLYDKADGTVPVPEDLGSEGMYTIDC